VTLRIAPSGEEKGLDLPAARDAVAADAVHEAGRAGSAELDAPPSDSPARLACGDNLLPSA
jgi:hypothetical protein